VSHPRVHEAAKLKDKQNVASIAPLAPQQQAMLLYCSEPGPGDLGFLPVRFDLRGDFDAEVWQAAWDEVVARHDALRTTIESPPGKRPMAVTWKAVPFAIDFQDLVDLSEEEQGAKIENHREASRSQGLALDSLPVFRVTVFALARQHHRVLWDCHHILLDGWSSSIIVSDLMTAYRAQRGLGSPLTPLSIRYSDYQSSRLNADSEGDRDFWRDHLSELPAPALLTDRALPYSAEAIERHVVAIDPDSSARIETAIRSSQSTASAAIRAGWALTLGSTLGRDDITFGAAVSGRSAEVAGVDALAGFFSNVVPSRVRIPPEKTTEEWLRELRDASLHSQPHEGLPLGQILQAAGVERAPFDTLLLVQNLPTGSGSNDSASETLQVERYSSATTSVYPLTLIAKPGASWEFIAIYDRRLLDADLVSELVGRLADLMSHLDDGLAEPAANLVEGLRPITALRSGPVESATGAPRLDSAPAARMGASALASTTVVLGYEAPRNRRELDLAELWQRILNVSPIGIQDNFFDLGGTSIQAVELFTEIARSFGERLQMSLLLQKPTIEELAGAIGTDAGQEFNCLVPIQTHAEAPALFCVHAGGGHVLFYRELALTLGEAASVYGLQPVGIDGKHPPLRTIEEIAARYLSEIRAVQPEGPYNLLGYCWGTTVVFEMARQLREAGERDHRVILVDSSAPRRTPRRLKHRIRARLQKAIPWRRRHILRALAKDPKEKREIEMLILQGICEEAFHEYQPERYPDPMLFLQGSESETWERDYWDEGFVEDWLAIAPQMEVRQFDCNHDEFFLAPHVSDTAEAVTGYIRRSDDDR